MSEQYNIVYSSEAVEDLKDIYSYIAYELYSPNSGKKQVNRIRKAIKSLDLMPSRYSLVDWEPWKEIGMHKVSVDNFVIFYTVDDNSMVVAIIRILYGGRDIKNIIVSNK